MLLPHFASVYFRGHSYGAWMYEFDRFGMIASPTFVLLSGMLLGYFASGDGSALTRLRAKLIDRALFLLIVGHAVVYVALSIDGHREAALLSTDAIAVSMVAGILLVPKLTPSRRLALAVSMYVGGWAVAYGWHPSSLPLQAIKEAAVGSFTWRVFASSSYPILPWCSVYLLGSVLGDRLGRYCRSGATRRAVVELRWLTVASIGAGVLLKGAAVLAQHYFLFDPHAAPYALLLVGEKYPPGPTYLLLYGGCAFGILAALLAAEQRQRLSPLVERASVFGRVSLPIFLVHRYVYAVLLHALMPAPIWEWPLYFAGSLMVLVAFAGMWHRYDGNRFLTVGYTWLADAGSDDAVRSEHGAPLRA